LENKGRLLEMIMTKSNKDKEKEQSIWTMQWSAIEKCSVVTRRRCVYSNRKLEERSIEQLKNAIV